MKAPTLLAALSFTTAVTACLSNAEREAEREYALTGVRPKAPKVVARAGKSNTFPIGKRDRFLNGCGIPVGLGTDERELESILNVKEVQSALKGLKKGFPDQVELFEPPFKTFEGRKFYGARVGDNPRVFIMSGIHARERGGPDNVIYFLSDLLHAKKAGTGVKYGDKEYSVEDVETALSAGVVVIPLTNPDGVSYDQKTDSCWRKNRNTASSKAADGSDIGVDLNRNYDFVWDYKKAFSADAEAPASDDPASEVFYGTGPASEAETKAVVWTLDQYQNITWFMDLHSYTGSILYGWGDDNVGTVATEENFVNPAFDGKRGIVGGEDPPEAMYKEYFTQSDFDMEVAGTDKMIGAMLEAGFVNYTNYEAVGLYPTSGASNDYAMGRYYGKLACGSSRMFGLTMEFGAESQSFPGCEFYPNKEEYHNSIRQVGAGFMEMMLVAAGESGEPLYLEC